MYIGDTQPNGLIALTVEKNKYHMWISLCHTHSFSTEASVNGLSLKQGTGNRGMGMGNGERGTGNL